MKHDFTVLCIAAALAILGGGSAQAGDNITFAFGDSAYTVGTGSKKAETINVAMHLQEPALVGLEVRAVRIPFPSADHLSGARAWLSKELPPIKSRKAGEPDIAQQAFQPAEGFVEVAFDQPYTITEEGLYVGYAFETEAVDNALFPIVLTGYTSPGAFLIHSTQVYRTAWQDRYPNAGQLAMQVVLGGDAVKTHAAGVGTLREVNVQVGRPTAVSFQVANHGSAGTTAIDYTVEAAGQRFDAHADLSLPPRFGATADVEFTMPAVEAKGVYAYSITIHRVNGQPNEDAGNTAAAPLNAYNTLPRHRAVLEEYTGTWCGYCPRGFVGLEEMNRLYPDDFIGISFHNGDPMEITTDYPNSVPGFPDAWLDRWYETDAFCGDADYGLFGIDKAWQLASDVFAPASVEVATQWQGTSQLHATATVTFPLGADENPYQLAFALTADGLSGTASDWNQSNYYAGAAGWPEAMDPFVQAGSSVSGLTYNDVLVFRSGKAGIAGSLSAPIEEDVPQQFGYDFDISALPSYLVPADRSKLRVNVLLIDSRDGHIVNANKAWAGSSSSGLDAIRGTDAARGVERTAYHDLLGRHTTRPQAGIYIQTQTLSDGTVRTRKVRF